MIQYYYLDTRGSDSIDEVGRWNVYQKRSDTSRVINTLENGIIIVSSKEPYINDKGQTWIKIIGGWIKMGAGGGDAGFYNFNTDICNIKRNIIHFINVHRDEIYDIFSNSNQYKNIKLIYDSIQKCSTVQATIDQLNGIQLLDSANIHNIGSSFEYISNGILSPHQDGGENNYTNPLNYSILIKICNFIFKKYLNNLEILQLLEKKILLYPRSSLSKTPLKREYKELEIDKCILDAVARTNPYNINSMEDYINFTKKANISATKIQKNYRGIIQRRKYIKQLNNLKILQLYYKRKFTIKKIIKIQKNYRRFSSKNRYNILMKSIIFIQYKIRKYQKKNEINKISQVLNNSKLVKNQDICNLFNDFIIGLNLVNTYGEKIAYEKLSSELKKSSKSSDDKLYSPEPEPEIYCKLYEDSDKFYIKEPPEDFICSFSSELMKDPVVTDNGYSYDRENITQWFNIDRGNKPLLEPADNTLVTNRRLTPNKNLKSRIESWKDKNHIPMNRKKFRKIRKQIKDGKPFTL